MEEEFEEEGASPRPEEGGGASEEEEEDEVEGEDNVSVFEMETSEDEERRPRSTQDGVRGTREPQVVGFEAVRQGAGRTRVSSPRRRSARDPRDPVRGRAPTRRRRRRGPLIWPTPLILDFLCSSHKISEFIP